MVLSAFLTLISLVSAGIHVCSLNEYLKPPALSRTKPINSKEVQIQCPLFKYFHSWIDANHKRFDRDGVARCHKGLERRILPEKIAFMGRVIKVFKGI